MSVSLVRQVMMRLFNPLFSLQSCSRSTQPTLQDQSVALQSKVGLVITQLESRIKNI